MTKRITSIFKGLWIVLVFAGALLYLSANFDTIAGELRQIALWRLLAAVLCLSGGKALMVQLSRASVTIVTIMGGAIAYRQMFYINSMSQLAKYLPGGIWHFVGRAGYYHAAGLTPAQNTQAIIIENIWLVSSAAFVGVALFALYSVDVLSGIIVAACMILLMLIVLVVIMRRLNSPFHLVWMGEIMIVQAVSWLLIGLSLWLLLPVEAAVQNLLLVVSVFAISWVVGYLSIFAPGGLGVRELVLTVMLGGVIIAPIALIYATIHRLTWILTELLLALVAQLLHLPAAKQ